MQREGEAAAGAQVVLVLVGLGDGIPLPYLPSNGSMDEGGEGAEAGVAEQQEQEEGGLKGKRGGGHGDVSEGAWRAEAEVEEGGTAAAQEVAKLRLPPLGDNPGIPSLDEGQSHCERGRLGDGIHRMRAGRPGRSQSGRESGEVDHCSLPREPSFPKQRRVRCGGGPGERRRKSKESVCLMFYTI